MTDHASTSAAVMTPAEAVALIDAVDGIVWQAHAPQMHMTFVSAQCEHILGYGQRQWTADAQFWHGLIHSEDREVTLAWWQACGTQAGRHEHSYRLLRADG